MKKIAVFGLALTVATAAQAAEWGFADWDANDDRVIDRSELDSGLAENEVFGAWDLNDDEVINELEWNEDALGSDFGEWDTDDDLGITEEEFSAGLYNDFDADDDLALSETEWNDGQESGWFDW